MSIFTPTVLLIFDLLSLGVVNLVHPKGSLALPSTCLAYSRRCCTPEACLTSRDATTSLWRSHSTCKQTILVALSGLKGNNVVDLEKLKQAEDEILGILGKWPKWKQAIAYRYLYNLEIRISDVDRIIQEGLGKKRE